MAQQHDYDFSPFDQLPLRCLGPGSRSNLSLFLNPEQLLASDSGHARDFRGIAELMAFSYTQIQNFKRSSDPFSALLDAYSCLPAGREASVKHLLLMLQQVGRYDVIDDVMPCLREDLSAFGERKPQSTTLELGLDAKPLNGAARDESDILSVDDIMTGAKTKYHAYVCYADADREFVSELSSRLEQEGVRLFIRERDNPAGALQYDVFTQLIQNRCGRVLVILSPDFLQCNECKMQTRFVASLAADQRTRKLIPVVYKACDSLPANLNMLTKIDFSRGDNKWAWNKLIVSVKSMDSNGGGFVPQHGPLTQSCQATCLTAAGDGKKAVATAAPHSSNGADGGCCANASASVSPASAADARAKPVMTRHALSCKPSGGWFKNMTGRFKSGKSGSESSKSQTDSRYHLIRGSEVVD